MPKTNDEILHDTWTIITYLDEQIKALEDLEPYLDLLEIHPDTIKYVKTLKRFEEKKHSDALKNVTF